MPEVPGQLGERTELDRSMHPPKIGHLHFIFDGWLGDELITCFPCYLVTYDLQKKLENSGLTGFEISNDLEIEYSELFSDLYPGRTMPFFVRLLIKGIIGDDFFMNGQNHLMLSERAFDFLKTLGSIKHCRIDKTEHY